MIIDRFVIHKLDPSMDVPILTDRVPFDFFCFDKFLKKQIKKQMRNDDTIRAKFIGNNNKVKELSEYILEDKYNFISGSKEIAAYYFDLMKDNNKLEPVNLVICQFQENAREYLAILKIENKETFNLNVYGESSDNKVTEIGVGIMQNKNTVATTLNQCAIVESDDLINMYDLTILDKDDSKEPLFTKFLQAEIIRDDTYKTKVFIELTSMYIDLIKDMEKKESTFNLLQYMLSKMPNMDVEDFIDKAGLDDDLRKTLSKYDIGKSFNVDRQVVNKAFKQRNIKTDTGFILKAKNIDFKDNTKYEIKTNDDGTTDLIVKNIKYFKEG